MAIGEGALPCCFEPHYESEASYVVFIMKISFDSYANKIILGMMYYSVSDTGILGKRKSECSYQESNLRPPDY